MSTARTLSHSKKNAQSDAAARRATVQERIDAAQLKLRLAEHEIAKLAIEHDVEARAWALREALARVKGAERALFDAAKELGHD